MAKFNVMQKERRKVISERKRNQRGDPLTGKLKNKQQPQSVSGKRQRKLLKKWRRDQKEAVEKGLITMEDVEMTLAEGSSQSQETAKAPKAFPVKKSLKLKQLKRKGKGKRKSSKPSAETQVDAMVE